MSENFRSQRHSWKNTEDQQWKSEQSKWIRTISQQMYRTTKSTRKSTFKTWWCCEIIKDEHIWKLQSEIAVLKIKYETSSLYL
jgi:hypothetical protein